VELQEAYSYILVCPGPPNQRILGHVVVDKDETEAGKVVVSLGLDRMDIHLLRIEISLPPRDAPLSMRNFMILKKINKDLYEA
jgi:hypothetical protein